MEFQVTEVYFYIEMNESNSFFKYSHCRYLKVEVHLKLLRSQSISTC